eukprot:1153435-Pelagomonas_calceolata.AAC.6
MEAQKKDQPPQVCPVRHGRDRTASAYFVRKPNQQDRNMGNQAASHQHAAEGIVAAALVVGAPTVGVMKGRLGWDGRAHTAAARDPQYVVASAVYGQEGLAASAAAPDVLAAAAAAAAAYCAHTL